MTPTLIGYARCSTDEQDLTSQREILRGLGVAEDRIYLMGLHRVGLGQTRCPSRRRVSTDTSRPEG
jgi:hypothetical protein